MTVHWPIIATCIKSPGRVLIIDDQREWRGVDLLVGAYHLAEHVNSVNRTDTLGIMLPTSGMFPLVALAGWILGKTIVPLNYLLKSAELQYVVDDSGVDTIVTCQPMLDFLDQQPRGPQIVCLEDINFKGVPELRCPRYTESEKLAAILYTSGTSGRPKGVMLSHGNLRSNVRQVLDWVHFTRDQSFLGVLPQFHSFGLTVLTLIPLMLGSRVIYSARFVPRRIVELLRKHKPAVLVAIPSMYNALLSAKNASPEDFSSLTYAVSGGEPLPDRVFREFRSRFGITINEGYGLTETSPVTHWCRPHEFRRHSVGRAIPGVRQRIVNPTDGKICPVGKEGEIQLAGPNIMKGYYNLPDETAAVFSEDGFFRTGDMGKVDEEGFLFITGRIKEMLIIGGENVFPREIEEILLQHPFVNAAAVIGAKDPSRGEIPIAFVEIKEGDGFDAQELRAWCRQHLAGYKVPREIRVLESLPRNPTGKVLRRELVNYL